MTEANTNSKEKKAQVIFEEIAAVLRPQCAETTDLLSENSEINEIDLVLVLSLLSEENSLRNELLQRIRHLVFGWRRSENEVIVKLQGTQKFFEEAVKGVECSTKGERILIIEEWLRALPRSDTTKIGLVSACKKKGVIKSIFALHEEDARKKLISTWGKPTVTSHAPLTQLREYLGESIGFYFAWLCSYTNWLLVPSVIGLLLVVLKLFHADEMLLPFYCIFICLWAILFCEFWRRRSVSIAFNWGSLDYEEKQSVRVDYREEEDMVVMGRTLLVWIVILILALCIVIIELGMIYWDEKVSKSDPGLLLSYAPNIVSGVIVNITNKIFVYIAVALNNYENHKTNSIHRNQLTIKLILFYFVNCNFSLFYICFYMGDMTKLREQLFSLLLTQQIMDNFQEAAVPYIKLLGLNMIRTKARAKSIKVNVSDLDKQKELDDYDDTFNDYLEMVIQFGYVCFFSSAFPLAALFCLGNNIVEQRSDSFKILYVCKRPVPSRASSIGSWQQILEAFTVIGVVVNCYILYTFFPNAFSVFGIDQSQRTWAVVVLEHALLLIIYGATALIPNEPGWVRREREKNDLIN